MHIFYSEVISIKSNSYWFYLSIFIFYDGNIDPKQVCTIPPSPGATEKFGTKVFYATMICFKNALKIWDSEVHFLLKVQAVGLSFTT